MRAPPYPYIFALGAAGLVAGLAASPVAAQQTAASSPEAVARQYIATLTAGNYAATAALMHPSALASIRRFIIAVAGRDPSGAALSQFAGVSDTAALRALPDTEMYARFLKATFAAQPVLGDAMKSATGSVIGHLDEGPDRTYVLYRLTMTIEGAEMKKVDVLTLQRSGTQWKAMLAADIENLIARLSTPAK